MQSEEKTNIILEKYYNRFNKFNSEVLQKLGETIKQFDGLTPSEAYQLGQELKYGYALTDVVDKLVNITGKTCEDVYKILDKVAEENVNFSEVYYKAKEIDFIPYEDNEEFTRYVKSLGHTINGEISNFTKTYNVGFSVYNKNTGKYEFKDLTSTYNELIDKAITQVSSGVEDYQSAMRSTMKQLASSGVKTVNYQGGYARRLDSVVRQTILDGLRDVNQGIQDMIGKEIGTNGVEISVHELCAFDHLPYQGRQFTNEEFKKLQQNLTRPIGEYNCKHFVFNVVLDVQEPNFTNKQLKNIEKESTKKITYEGKTYTKYEATQVQRRIETEIRKAKDKQIIARASGDKDGILQAQSKITQLTNKYKDFSKVAGIDTYMERLTVSGYRRVAVK